MKWVMIHAKEGDLNGTYYTYSVLINDVWTEACDPYARTTGVNGKRAMVIDLDSTDPEGWENDTDPHAGQNITDAVIYELHVRDLSIDESSGINAKGITFAIQTFSVKITGAVSSALAIFLLGLFSWVSVEAESFKELAEMGIEQPPEALKGLWIVYALVPVIGMMISTVFYLFYKLNDKDVQIMAKCNSGEITREEAEKLLSRKY